MNYLQRNINNYIYYFIILDNLSNKLYQKILLEKDSLKNIKENKKEKIQKIMKGNLINYIIL